MSTGTIQNPAVQVITDMKSDVLQFTFTNGNGSALVVGDEVVLNADGSVSARTSGASRPLGIVVVGGEDGKRVTVRTFFTAVINAYNNSAGAIDAGNLCYPVGSKTDDKPNYNLVALDEYSCAVAITQSAAGSDVKIGILDSITTRQV